jgi:DNA-binding IclR family transcriptional regulator
LLPAQPNQSLIEGLVCLQALATRESPVGVRQLARELGLDRTRTHRLLATLAHLGLAQRDPSRKYSVGPGIHVLAAQCLHASRLLQRAARELEALHRFGHTTALGVLWNEQLSYLYHAEPGMKWEDALGRLALFPATLSGLGLAILSRQPEEQVRELYRSRPMPGFEAGVEALLEELHRARERGWALGYPQGRKSLDRSVGVALESDPNAAIGVAGNLEARMTTRIAQAVREAASRIDATPVA